MSSLRTVILIGILFHAIYMLSIFDIYFRSPLVHGMAHHSTPESQAPAPADRLVLFVADGLRADKFFQDANLGEQHAQCWNTSLDSNTNCERKRAPFLNNLIRTKAAFGVSHTRVPTESRPGHVALIAGFYEDVSAVTKGWQKNPVEFDSVFNQSSHTFSFGSPDILPMFAEECPHVDTHMYGSEAEDFGSTDTTKLDTWVFDHVRQLFKNSSQNSTLNDLIMAPKTVFFLHLLGMDTSGHAYRPYSQEYYRNLQVVDQGIKDMVDLFEAKFPDGKTAYVFTADHGMSNKGSHGDGETANTETPIVVWGAGAARPVRLAANKDVIKKSVRSPDSWGVNHLWRRDINQADVAPLMASLIGIPIPVNSVGVLPTEFLDPDHPNHNGWFLWNNARQMITHFRRKAQLKKQSAIRFVPYPPLADESRETHALDEIEHLLRSGQYSVATQKSLNLINTAVDGLRYFQTYDWPFLMTVITLGYLGWIAYLATLVAEQFSVFGSTSDANERFSMAYSIAAAIFIAISSYLYLESSPLMYYAYVVFPCYFWAQVVARKPMLSVMWFVCTANRQFTIRIISTYVALGIFVQCIALGFFYRQTFTVIFAFVSIYALLTYKTCSSLDVKINYSFCISSAILSIFTLLPLETELSPVAQGLGLLAFIVIRILMSWQFNKPITSITILQLAIVAASSWIVFSTDQALADKQGLSTFNQIAAWSLLIISMLMHLISYRTSQSPTPYNHRLIDIITNFAPSMILLSIHYEFQFYSALSLNLMQFIAHEKQIDSQRCNPVKQDTSRQGFRYLKIQDVITAVFLILYINIAFFGTGNVASMSSFEIASTYRFTTVFDPFLMGAMLIWKILVPFIIVTVTFRMLAECLCLNMYSLFLTMLPLLDLMTITFFFFVKDSGSWKEIGTSIGHFGILNAQIIFVLLLFALTYSFTTGVTYTTKETAKEK